MKILPTLRQLRYLVSVAEYQHFGQAAEACNVTQSTLSAGIMDLEGTLGLTLVDRTNRRQVMLTPAGEEAAARAAVVLRTAEDMVDAVRATAEPLVGKVRLGVIPTIGPYLLPAVLPALRKAYPKLSLYLREAQSALVLDMVAQAELDCAVIALPYEGVEAFRAEALGTDDLMAACPADHPWAALDEVSQEALLEETLLLLEDGHCLRDHAIVACRLADRAVGEEFQATSLSTLVQMVAGGLGVTLLPKLAMPVEARPDLGITVRPVENGKDARTVALVWRRGSPRHREFTLLAKELRKVMRELASSPSMPSR